MVHDREERARSDDERLMHCDLERVRPLLFFLFFTSAYYLLIVLTDTPRTTSLMQSLLHFHLDCRNKSNARLHIMAREIGMFTTHPPRLLPGSSA